MEGGQHLPNSAELNHKKGRNKMGCPECGAKMEMVASSLMCFGCGNREPLWRCDEDGLVCVVCGKDPYRCECRKYGESDRESHPRQKQ